MVELRVVLAIIAIVVAIAMPILTTARLNASEIVNMHRHGSNWGRRRGVSRGRTLAKLIPGSLPAARRTDTGSR